MDQMQQKVTPIIAFTYFCFEFCFAGIKKYILQIQTPRLNFQIKVSGNAVNKKS